MPTTIRVGAVALTMAVAVTALAQAPKDRRREGTLKVGDTAPSVTADELASGKSVKLADLRGRPTVLIFGSCTCTPFRNSVRAIEKLYADYKDKAHVYAVYIREAHPTDGWQVPQNERDKILIKDPTSLDERKQVAADFATQFSLRLPILVDPLDDPFDKAFAGWPDRVYVLVASC